MRERAVRMVFEHEGEFDSQSVAIKSIAPKIGCGHDTPEPGLDGLRLIMLGEAV